MVVLSSALISKTKPLLARQYVEMTRLRVDGLLNAFPKLIEGVEKRDHTYVETENVRYVYQPMEGMFLVLITNKTSNILEDLETLRLLAKVVQDTCEVTINEDILLEKAFDIIFAFDEVISFGYRESVTLSQIKTYTEMDSHDEKIHQMIQQSKEAEARETAKRKQMELAKARAVAQKEERAAARAAGNDSGGFGDKLSGMGGGMGSGGMGGGPSGPGGVLGGNNIGLMSQEPQQQNQGWGMDNPVQQNFGGQSAPKSGMSLGKKKPAPQQNNFQPMQQQQPQPTAAPAAQLVEEEPAQAINPLLDPVNVEMEETVSASLEKEGGLNGDATVEGVFKVTVLDVSKADLVAFKLSQADPRFKMRVHPNLNKTSQADNNVLEPRDPSRAYKANSPAPLLKWKMTSNDDSTVPLTIGCWPSAANDGTSMTLEIELQEDNQDKILNNVLFKIPCPANPDVDQPEVGQFQYNPNAQMLQYHIPQIDSSSGTITFEFKCTGADEAHLFPVQVTCESTQLVNNMQVENCYHQQTQDSVNCNTTVKTNYELTIGN